MFLPYLRRLDLEDICRAGRWDQSVVVGHYLTGTPASALLALHNYPCKGSEDLDTAFWAERFVFADQFISAADMAELKPLLLPFVSEFKDRLEEVKTTGKAGLLSAANFLEAAEYLMEVGVQDSFELHDMSLANPIVKRLKGNPTWERLYAQHQASRLVSMGGSRWPFPPLASRLG